MQVGDKVKYIHNNNFDDNSYMLLYNNTGVITRVAEKYGKEYVEVCFDKPIYLDYDDGRHYFCFAEHLQLISK